MNVSLLSLPTGRMRQAEIAASATSVARWRWRQASGNKKLPLANTLLFKISRHLRESG